MCNAYEILLCVFRSHGRAQQRTFTNIRIKQWKNSGRANNRWNCVVVDLWFHFSHETEIIFVLFVLVRHFLFLAVYLSFFISLPFLRILPSFNAPKRALPEQGWVKGKGDFNSIDEYKKNCENYSRYVQNAHATSSRDIIQHRHCVCVCIHRIKLHNKWMHNFIVIVVLELQPLCVRVLVQQSSLSIAIYSKMGNTVDSFMKCGALYSNWYTLTESIWLSVVLSSCRYISVNRYPNIVS